MNSRSVESWLNREDPKSTVGTANGGYVIFKRKARYWGFNEGTCQPMISNDKENEFSLRLLDLMGDDPVEVRRW